MSGWTSHEQLIRAVQKATRKLASSGNFNLLMKDVLVICVEAVGAFAGTIYLHDPAGRRLKFQHVLPEDIVDKLPTLDMADDFGMAGAAFQARSTICREFPKKSESDWNSFERATGVPIENMVATPLMMEDEMPIGVVQLLNKVDGAFSENDCAVLDTIAAVFDDGVHELPLDGGEFAGVHPSRNGKVGHDIGNLAASLYATLSFSDMAMNGLKGQLAKAQPDSTVQMYVDTLDPMFHDLKLSVDRIVGYSQLISDMSAGRALRPNKSVASLATTVQASAAYLWSEARNSHVRLNTQVDESAPATLFDELYIFRIVQNLVGNAIKAVKETVPDSWVDATSDDEEEPAVFGEVFVDYRFECDTHIIEVRDTGPGMSKETGEKILSGNARSQWDKASGSGWGMKIVLELAQTHDARVTLDSELGKGTTFRVRIPHCGD